MPKKSTKNKEIEQVKGVSLNVGEYVAPGWAKASRVEDGIEERALERGSRGNSLLGGNLVDGKFPNIAKLPTPFCKYDGYIGLKDTIDLVEKAYFGFKLYQNVVETQVELANTDVYLTGSNKQAREFILAWFKKIKRHSVSEQWFRDYFWKANVYPYRLDAEMEEGDVRKLQRALGNKETTVASKKLPIEYEMLNPRDMVRDDGFYYEDVFYKRLSAKDIERIKNPKDEDKDFIKSFKPAELKAIKEDNQTYIKIDPLKLRYTAYKRQSYYPFGVPFVFGVLEDIDYKLLLKELDREIVKTFDFAILHFASGLPPDQGGINYNNITALQSLFTAPKLQRVLVTDHGVKGQWLVPPLHELLSADKYIEVNRGLREGLFSSIFDSESKFANMQTAVRMFVDKLDEVRRIQIEEFWQPEIDALSKLMNFKSPPQFHFTKIDLEDSSNFQRLVTRLIELGYIGPFLMNDAIEKGILPTKEDVLEEQEELKKLRDKEWFLPQLNFKKEEPVAAVSGRPAGSKKPKSSKKRSVSKASLSTIVTKAQELTKLEHQILAELNKGTLKDLEDANKNSMVANIAHSIAMNEKDWEKAVNKYVKNPVEINKEAKAELNEIKDEFELDERGSILVWLSKE